MYVGASHPLKYFGVVGNGVGGAGGRGGGGVGGGEGKTQHVNENSLETHAHE